MWIRDFLLVTMNLNTPLVFIILIKKKKEKKAECHFSVYRLHLVKRFLKVHWNKCRYFFSDDERRWQLLNLWPRVSFFHKMNPGFLSTGEFYLNKFRSLTQQPISLNHFNQSDAYYSDNTAPCCVIASSSYFH